jgi:RNA polymerase sigma factor (sigma-70 family)
MDSSEDLKDFHPPFADPLLSRAIGGDREAQHRLLERFEPRILLGIRRHLSPERFREEGEDLLQTIRLALLKSLPTIRCRYMEGFASWLEKLVRCRLLDWEKARRSRRRSPTRPPVSLEATDAPEPAAGTLTPSRIVMRKESRLCLERAIADAPERYRETLRFLYEKDPTLPEVAAFLGKKPDAARKFMARALNHLRRSLGGREGTGIRGFP